MVAKRGMGSEGAEEAWPVGAVGGRLGSCNGVWEPLVVG